MSLQFLRTLVRFQTLILPIGVLIACLYGLCDRSNYYNNGDLGLYLLWLVFVSLMTYGHRGSFHLS